MHGCVGKSAIKSDDSEWYFFSPRELKYSNGKQLKRATQSGYWKITGKVKNIKAKGTNKVIGTKKFLVFYTGRVPVGKKTSWVMHEYQPEPATPSHQVGVHVMLLFIFSLIVVTLSLWYTHEYRCC